MTFFGFWYVNSVTSGLFCEMWIWGLKWLTNSFRIDLRKRVHLVVSTASCSWMFDQIQAPYNIQFSSEKHIWAVYHKNLFFYWICPFLCCPVEQYAPSYPTNQSLKRHANNQFSKKSQSVFIFFCCLSRCLYFPDTVVLVCNAWQPSALLCQMAAYLIFSLG